MIKAYRSSEVVPEESRRGSPKVNFKGHNEALGNVRRVAKLFSLFVFFFNTKYIF